MSNQPKGADTLTDKPVANIAEREAIRRGMAPDHHQTAPRGSTGTSEPAKWHGPLEELLLALEATPGAWVRPGWDGDRTAKAIRRALAAPEGTGTSEPPKCCAPLADGEERDDDYCDLYEGNEQSGHCRGRCAMAPEGTGTSEPHSIPPLPPVSCGQCGRKSWSDTPGTPCDFPQPNGSRCLGVLRAHRAPEGTGTNEPTRAALAEILTILWGPEPWKESAEKAVLRIREMLATPQSTGTPIPPTGDEPTT